MVKFGWWVKDDMSRLFLIHIRDFQKEDKFHKALPKGIALTIDVWRKFNANIRDINEDIEKLY
jgi:hypothetical protein